MSKAKVNNFEDDFLKDKEENQYLIPNVARSIKVLEYLTKKEYEASTAQIAADLSYPKNSVFRIIKTLEFYGYVEEVDRKYRATQRLLYLGYAGIRSSGLVENALDEMKLLRDEINETVLIGSLMGNEVVIIEQVQSFHHIKFTTEIGRRVMLHVSAPGKAILSYLPEVELMPIIDQMNYTRFNNNTIPSRNAILTELEQVREKGYSVDDGEEFEDIHCIGAPIFDYRHYPIASIWMVGPDYRVKREDYDKIGGDVIRSAERISRRFGYDPGKSF